MIIHQAHSETTDIHDNSMASPDSFHSVEDDGERDCNNPHSIVILNTKLITGVVNLFSETLLQITD